MIARLFVTISLGIILSGCQSIPPLNFSVPDVGYSQKKIDAELKSMTVSLARPDEKKGEIHFGMEEVPRYWQNSLQESLDRMSIFKDDAKKKVNLSVKILGFEMSGLGGVDTTSTARYEIFDRSNGDLIFAQEISAVGAVPWNHAFVGVVRMRESINRSVQNNIATFLQSLETLDITKPMFPQAANNK